MAHNIIIINNKLYSRKLSIKVQLALGTVHQEIFTSSGTSISVKLVTVYSMVLLCGYFKVFPMFGQTCISGSQ